MHFGETGGLPPLSRPGEFIGLAAAMHHALATALIAIRDSRSLTSEGRLTDVAQAVETALESMRGTIVPGSEEDRGIASAQRAIIETIGRVIRNERVTSR